MEPDKKTDTTPEIVQTTETKPITTAPIIPPPTIHEFHENPGRRWPTVIGYILAALLVAVAVVYLGRWIYHKTTHQSTKPTPSANSDKVPATPPSTPNQTPSSTTPSQTPQPTATGQLPNNGPGDVIAIFLGVSVAFGGLHYLLSLRRAS